MLKPCPAGGMWICVSGMGLWEDDPDRQERPIQRLKGDKDDMTGVLLAEDGAGGFWFGSESGKIGRLTGGSTNFLGHLEGAGNHKVVSFQGDSAGGVWARIERSGDGSAERTRQANRVGWPCGGAASKLNPMLARMVKEGCGWGRRWDYIGGANPGFCSSTQKGPPEVRWPDLLDDLSGRLWRAANNKLFRLTKKELEELGHKRHGGASTGCWPQFWINVRPFRSRYRVARSARPGWPTILSENLGR